jgi:hypothetical protein
MATVLVYFAGLMNMYIQSGYTRKRTPHLTYEQLPIKQSQTIMSASSHALRMSWTYFISINNRLNPGLYLNNI